MGRNYHIDTEYIELVQEELLLKRKQIKTLIDQKTVLGNYYEKIAKDAIERIIPDTYSLATGIVIANKKSSKQIDIIIYDNSKSYPIFKAGDMIIIDPDPVRVVIEVKGTLRTKDLDAAIKNLAVAQELFIHNQQRVFKNHSKKICTILFAFSTNMNIDNIKKKCESNGVDYACILSKNEQKYNGGLLGLIEHLEWWLVYGKDTEFIIDSHE